jgi:hypothetical protein
MSAREIREPLKDSFEEADDDDTGVPDEVVEKEENIKARLSARGAITPLKLKLASPDGLLKSLSYSMSSSYDERLAKA